MRISDWSSDVCSSDLLSNMDANSMDLSDVAANSLPGMIFDLKRNPGFAPYGPATGKMLNGKYATARSAGNYLAGLKDRKSVVYGKSVSVRVDFGGRRIIKKKKTDEKQINKSKN